MKKIIASLLIGFLAGAAGINLITAREIDRLYLEKKEMQVEIYDLSLQLEKLQEQLASNQPSVETVEVAIINREQLSPFTIVGIKREVQKLTQDLVGQDLEAVNPHLLSRLLNGRIIEVEGKKFTLSIELIIIGEKTVVETKVIPKQEIKEEEA